MSRTAGHATTSRHGELLEWTRALFRAIRGHVPTCRVGTRPLSLREERRLLRMTGSGLARLDDYLARQAEFDAWCRRHHRSPTPGRSAPPDA